MIISSPRLFLRNYELTDFAAVHEYGSDPEFSKYELWGPNSEKDTRDFIAGVQVSAQKKPRHQFEMAVCLKNEDIARDGLAGIEAKERSGELIGGCGLRRESADSSIANMGWAINPRFQGQGYATEAAGALIDWAQKTLPLKVVYATCDVRNVASYRVMEKLGMKRVGFLKGNLKVKGHVRDSYRYELVF